MKNKISIIVVFIIIISMSISVYADYVGPLPAMPETHTYGSMLIAASGYLIFYSDNPLIFEKTEVHNVYITVPPYTSVKRYVQAIGTNTWYALSDLTPVEGETHYYSDEILWANYGLGLGQTTFEIEEKQDSFFGINFDYQGFFGDLKVKLGKEENGQYREIKQWTYPSGEGTVNIPANDIPQGQTGNYQIVIMEGDTIINTYNFVQEVEKERIAKIEAPGDNVTVDYFPNIQYKLQNTPPSRIEVNGKTVKWLGAVGEAVLVGIESGDWKAGALQLGINSIKIIAEDGTVLDENQFTITRQNEDTTTVPPEQQLGRLEWTPVGNTLEEFITSYNELTLMVKTIFNMLPAQWIFMGTFAISISLVLWFTRLRHG